MRWQPISEAPKDGTDVLIYDDEFGPEMGGWNGKYWRESGTCLERNPTHFMLITPPGEQQACGVAGFSLEWACFN